MGRVVLNEETGPVCMVISTFSTNKQWGGVLTWVIGAKSTNALSAGHISSNQQDDASRLRLL